MDSKIKETENNFVEPSESVKIQVLYGRENLTEAKSHKI